MLLISNVTTVMLKPSKYFPQPQPQPQPAQLKGVKHANQKKGQKSIS
jgi:hypothetical protein